jgi:hypothetical protein
MSRQNLKKSLLDYDNSARKKFGVKRGLGKEESLPFVIVDKVNPTHDLLGVGGSEYVTAYST